MNGISSIFRSILFLVLLAWYGGSLGFLAYPAKAEVTASKVKAGFLLNFIRLTTFPSTIKEETLELCTSAGTPEAEHLSALHGQQVLGSFISIRTRFTEDCDVMFLAASSTPSEKAHFSRVAKSDYVLSVVDTPEDFMTSGILQFYTDNQKIRFRVHKTRLKRSELRLSSQLLNLAELVEDNDDD